MNALKVWDNPLVIRGVRSRLRLPYAVSWGLVTIVASMFLYVGVSGNAIRHGNVTPSEAAREAILPLLIMQGLILMVLGTGAVAGGMARERTYRLLDYQRLTPLSPGTKIVGLLLGLPIREYYMFAVSLPFVFYAAWVGGMSFGVLVQFYAVFISSAVVYHMTGLAAGMVVDKPWRAGTASQGLVVVLYLFLPQVSHLGFTFFEFLTARPVFYGLVNQYLLPDGLEGFVQEALTDARYQEVAFFGMRLSPTVFSFAVQGYALITLYLIIYRKWQSESRLPFSKGYALLFFAVAQMFLVGSVQPFLRNDTLFSQIVTVYSETDPVSEPQGATVFLIFLINLAVSGCAAMMTVYLCTPRWHQSVAGLRRAVRKGTAKLSWAEDAASSLPVAIACALMSALGFIAVFQTAQAAGRIDAVNTPAELLVAMLFFSVVLLTVQQVCEQFSERIFVMGLFVFWLVPVLAAIIIATAFERPVMGMYVGLFFPGLDLYMISAMLVSDLNSSSNTEVLPLGLAAHANPVLVGGLTVYGTAALVLLVRARRRWRRIRLAAGVRTDEPVQSSKSVTDKSDLQPAPAYVTANNSVTPR